MFSSATYIFWIFNVVAVAEIASVFSSNMLLKGLSFFSNDRVGLLAFVATHPNWSDLIKTRVYCLPHAPHQWLDWSSHQWTVASHSILECHGSWAPPSWTKCKIASSPLQLRYFSSCLIASIATMIARSVPSRDPDPRCQSEYQRDCSQWRP